MAQASADAFSTPIAEWSEHQSVNFLLTHQPLRYADWHEFFAGEAVRLATILFLVSLFLHTWVGVRNIVMDYLENVVIRLAAQVLAILTLTAYAAWSIQILWGIK